MDLNLDVFLQRAAKRRRKAEEVINGPNHEAQKQTDHAQQIKAVFEEVKEWYTEQCKVQLEKQGSMNRKSEEVKSISHEMLAATAHVTNHTLEQIKYIKNEAPSLIGSIKKAAVNSEMLQGRVIKSEQRLDELETLWETNKQELAAVNCQMAALTAQVTGNTRYLFSRFADAAKAITGEIIEEIHVISELESFHLNNCIKAVATTMAKSICNLKQDLGKITGADNSIEKITERLIEDMQSSKIKQPPPLKGGWTHNRATPEEDITRRNKIFNNLKPPAQAQKDIKTVGIKRLAKIKTAASRKERNKIKKLAKIQATKQVDEGKAQSSSHNKDPTHSKKQVINSHENEMGIALKNEKQKKVEIEEGEVKEVAGNLTLSNKIVAVTPDSEKLSLNEEKSLNDIAAEILKKTPGNK